MTLISWTKVKWKQKSIVDLEGHHKKQSTIADEKEGTHYFLKNAYSIGQFWPEVVKKV